MSSNYCNTFYIKPIENKEKFVNEFIDFLTKQGIYCDPLVCLEKVDSERELINFKLGDFGLRLYLWPLDKTIYESDDFELFHIIRKISFTSNDTFFMWEGWKERILKLMNIFKSAYNFINPFYGRGDCEENLIVNDSVEYTNAKKNVITKIYWSNFFGPQLVEKYGREKLLSAPSWKTEELSDGGIMLLVSSNPFGGDSFSVSPEDVEKYLGIR